MLFRDAVTDNKISERELLYKVLFDMRRDINDLKSLVGEIIDQHGLNKNVKESSTSIINKKYFDNADLIINPDTEEKPDEEITNHEQEILFLNLK